MMSKTGIVIWVGILLMVIGYVIVPEYAMDRTHRTLGAVAATGGAASTSEVALSMQRSLEISMNGQRIGMAGVIAIILAFVRRTGAKNDT